jgi:type II secretion system protein G
MIQKLRDRSRSESGFTLVELLVVMLIIGLLAAIAIPSFFNQREKANDASAKEDAHTAQTAMETYATDNAGSYTGGTPAELVAIEPALSNADLTTVAGNDSYTVTVEAQTTNRDFSIARASNGSLSYPCTPDGGGCDGTQWNP